MSKHTPGPWWTAENYYGDNVYDSTTIVAGETGEHGTICDVFGQHDARLIAAAPELLAAAKLALEYINALPAPAAKNLQVADRFSAMRLKEAIAKAEGGARPPKEGA